MMSSDDKRPETPDGKYVTAEKLAKLLNLSVRRVQALRADGAFVVDDTPMGKRYVFGASLVAYIRYLQNRQDTASLERQRLEADVKFRNAKAKVEEIKLALLKGEVHKAEHVRVLLNGMVQETKAALMAIPGRCAMDCAGAAPNEAANIIKEAVFSVLADMSTRTYDPDMFAALVEADGDQMANGDEEDNDL